MAGSYNPPIGSYSGSPGPTVVFSETNLAMERSIEEHGTKRGQKCLREVGKKLLQFCKQTIWKGSKPSRSGTGHIARASSPHLYPTPPNRHKRPIRDFSRDVCITPAVSVGSSDEESVHIQEAPEQHKPQLISRLLGDTARRNENIIAKLTHRPTYESLTSTTQATRNQKKQQDKRGKPVSFDDYYNTDSIAQSPLYPITNKGTRKNASTGPNNNLYTDRNIFFTAEAAAAQKAQRATEATEYGPSFQREEFEEEGQNLETMGRTARFAWEQHEFVVKHRGFYDLDARLFGRKAALFGLDCDEVSLWGESEREERTVAGQTRAPRSTSGAAAKLYQFV